MATKKSSAKSTETQDIYTSRSEKKRLAKNIEQLATELVDLSVSDINKLPCDDFLKGEIKQARDLKAGARKRQVKYIAKELRNASAEELLVFLEEKKGSHLKQAAEFHELEQLREDIISEVLADQDEARRFDDRLNESWESEAIAIAAQKFPELDLQAMKIAALRYAKTRKPVYRRELFRQLKAAQERLQFAQDQETTQE